MKKIVSFALCSVLATALTVPTFASPAAGQAPASAPAAKTTSKAAATPAPTAQEIADAQSKGMVWVNTNSKVYHTGGEFYGKTKHGKFMTKDDAEKAGFKAAKEPAAKKTTTTTPPKK